MPFRKSSRSPKVASSPLPSVPPEFALIDPRGTLRIPLTSRRASTDRNIDVASVHVDAGQPLPVPPLDASHRAIAPAAGTVRSSCEAILFDARSVPVIEFVCDSSGSSEAKPAVSPVADDQKLSEIQSIRKEEIPGWFDRIRDAGIWADRRGCPDLLMQLFQSTKRPIDTLICTMLDSDPTACVSAALASQFTHELLAGTAIIEKISGASQTWFCADQRIPGAWWAKLRKLIRKTSMRFVPMPNDYPQADPTLLLFTCVGRRLRPGRLPTEQGVVLIDSAAAVSIGRLALADEPMLRTPLVVREHTRKLSHFLFAPIGMSLNDLRNEIGGNHPDVTIRGGDLLRDLKITGDAVVSGSELVVHISSPEPAINPDACIRCGWCYEACPTRVQPAAVLEAAQRDDLDLAERAGIEACVDCGICSYVCPSKLPLLEGIRKMNREYVKT